MSKYLSLIFGLTTVCLFQAGCGEPESSTAAPDEAVQLVYEGKLTVPQAQASCRCRLELVPIGGTVFHFGLDLSQSPPVSYPFQSTVAGARVSIAEAPITRFLNIRSDANGKLGLKAVKVQGTPLRISFVYQLTGYTTTKSQVFEVADSGITDLAVQFSTATYFSLAKGQIEQQIAALIGAPYPLTNVLVTTVGKSWVSLYSPELPHGDPGAQVSISPAIAFPASLGPVYFNEFGRARPDLDQHVCGRRCAVRQPRQRQPYDHRQQGAFHLFPADLRRPGWHWALRRVAPARHPRDERLASPPAVNCRR